MHIYILKRILWMIPVLLGVSLVVFSMMYIAPGDPARMILGEGAPEAEVKALRREMGLEDPFLIQYGRYVAGVVLRGDLGTSYITGRSVTAEILDRWPTTMLLAVLSVLVATLIGIPTGIISATRQYSAFDNLAMVLALVGVSMPNFWQGLILILIFSVGLGGLPASGFYGPVYWILPALTIGTSTAATVTRMTRSPCWRWCGRTTSAPRGPKGCRDW
jgi:peptide/nickel transport system permease protein